jgi:nucleoid-associated protein YgaU
MECPICNKAGLPDFTNIHTVCPQCNSDLKPFLLLKTIAKPSLTPKKYLLALGGAALIALLFIGLYFIALSEKRNSEMGNVSASLKYQDSIRILKLQISKEQGSKAGEPILEKDVIVHYKIKKDDCLSRIAQFFYNDWQKYKVIEIDNNLHNPYTLKVGQVLYIKLKQQ